MRMEVFDEEAKIGMHLRILEQNSEKLLPDGEKVMTRLKSLPRARR